MEEIAAKIKAKNGELDIALGNLDFVEKMRNQALQVASNIRKDIGALYKELNEYLGSKTRY